MNLKMTSPLPASPVPQVPIGLGGNSTATAAPAGVVERSVYCSHGIHNGHFPVAGLSVGEARRTLGHLLNIDPEAVAVIGGQIVGDDHIIASDTAMLTFVKKSSVKG